MLHEEFGVTHPHECDCGKGEGDINLREALARCIFVMTMLNDRIDKLEDKVEAAKGKDEGPIVVKLEIYDGYVDIVMPEMVSEEKLAELFIEIGENFEQGEDVE